MNSTAVSNGEAQSSVEMTNKTVTFAKIITITEFPMVLGDNPACSVGGPIQLGWQAQHTMTHELDIYEKDRVNSRRRGSNLIISCNERSSLLLQAGYTVEEIVLAANEARAIQLELRKSIQKCQKSRTSITQRRRLSSFGKKARKLPKNIFRGMGGGSCKVNSSYDNVHVSVRPIRKTVSANVA